MPAELDNLDPEMDQSAEMDPNAGLDAEPADTAPTGDVIGTHGQTDREGAMAKADLFKLANYSHKLYQKLQDDDQLEAWVQAKITKAADYVASVYHYLEYEMKFSEYGHHLDNSDTLSEGQKMKIKELLAEAKGKMKDLKKSQAEKVKAKKVEEGILSGGEQPCAECGGTGTVHMAPATIPDHVKSKVEKYNKQAKAFHAASKRLDKNHNGIPDDEEVDEGFGDAEPKEMKTGDKKKTRTGELTKTSTGVVHKNTSYHDDGDEIASNAKSGKGIKSHAKAQSAAEKKEKAPAQKQSPKSAKTWGMKDGEKFDNRDKEKEVDESIVGRGVYEAKKAKKDYDQDGKIESGKDEYLGSRIRAAKKAGKLKEGQKCNECGMMMEKCSCMHESAKPSAGLSKAKKSAVVKDAKAGKDIGKPGKSFDKVAKSAGGGEKGKKIAAAAMWKNIKETQMYIAEKAKAVKDLPGKQEKLDVDKDGKLEKSDFAALRAGKKPKETVKESSDFSRLQELTGRLNRAEKPMVVESREVDEIRALTKRLLG
jgi:hypothetical protein